METQRGRQRYEKQDVVRVVDRGVGLIAVRVPQIAVVEGRQFPGTRRHVLKTAHPDKSIRAIQIPELTNHRHAGCIQWIGKGAIEQIDEGLPSVGVKRVLSQLHDIAAVGCRMESVRLRRRQWGSDHGEQTAANEPVSTLPARDALFLRLGNWAMVHSLPRRSQ